MCVYVSRHMDVKVKFFGNGKERDKDEWGRKWREWMRMENRGQWKKVRDREQEWSEWEGERKVQPKEKGSESTVCERKKQAFFLLLGNINILLAFMFAWVGGRQCERQAIVPGDSISSLFSLLDTGVNCHQATLAHSWDTQRKAVTVI